MAVTFTSILGLKLSSDFSDELTFNFNKIDELATVYQRSADGGVTMRSRTDITFESNSPDLGGNGSVGTIDFQGATIAGMSLDWDDVTNKTANTLPDLTAFITAHTDVASNTAHQSLTTTHGVTGNLVGTTDAQTLTNKTLAAASNTITGLKNAAIDAAAAISGTKISPDFGSQFVKTLSGFRFEKSGWLTTLRPAQSGQTTNLTWDFPSADGTVNQVLSTNGAGKLSWKSTSASISTTSFAWLSTDFDDKTFTHNFGTKNITVTIFDENDETISVDTEKRTNINDLRLIRSGAVGGNWTVLITNTGT